jgi:flagellar hook protein FlgE
MLRSMFSGVSGLRSHQTMMDVIGNNISNVNTVGYKSSGVIFSDLLSQVIRGAGVPTAGAVGNGGTNPAQVGLGVKLAGISTSFSQGAAQLTGRATDLSIQGDGFFVARQGNENLYTRAGSLSFDALGRLVSPDGGILQGWSADANGAINTNSAVGDITMPLGQSIAPMASQNVRLGGNLNATPLGTYPGNELITSITVYDDQGTARNLTFGFTMTADNEWDLQVYEADGADADTDLDTLGAVIALQFDPATGELTSPTTPPTVTPTQGEWTNPVTLDFGAAGDPEALQQFSGPNSVQALSQDGSALGSLQSFSIGQDGIVTGVFSNGRNRPIGQLALASFANPVGLEKVGGSLYRPTVNSGLANIGIAGAGGRGTLQGSTLEMSNVDLAQEFTSLIVAQRGFQANSRVITSSDELLQDLVNLKR